MSAVTFWDEANFYGKICSIFVNIIGSLHVLDDEYIGENYILFTIQMPYLITKITDT